MKLRTGLGGTRKGDSSPPWPQFLPRDALDEALNNQSVGDRFALIRSFYDEACQRRLERRSDEWGQDAYAWDVSGTGISLTPIEYALWCDIRVHDIVMYPQYPVGRFFVDFGNPAARVAIECDGERYHQDVERDMQREQEIRAMGWKVYRISGRDCLKDTEEFEDEEGRIHVELSPARRFIIEIASRHPVRRGGNL